MQPELAARLLAKFGIFFLAVLLILRGLSLAETIQSPVIPSLTEPEPVTGEFTITESGKQIVFRQVLVPPVETDRFETLPEWFFMNIEGGPIFPTAKPESDIRPFVIREGQLFIFVGDGFGLTTGSLPGTKVLVTSRSPLRDEIAFFAIQESGPGGLYVLSATGQLRWLGEESSISSINWSPDGQQIAYAATRDGTDQILVVDRYGKQLRLITRDQGRKSSPIWLADSKTIIFIHQKSLQDDSLPLSKDLSAIYQVTTSAPTPELLLDRLSQITTLNVINNNQGIAFTQPDDRYSQSEQYFVLDPKTRSVSRLYPPLSIDALICPEKIAINHEGTIQFDLSNTSQRPASVPLILRAGNKPLPILGERKEGAYRIEAIDLNSGEVRRVEWSVTPKSGIRTYLSLIIDLGGVYPLAVEKCVIKNTYLGLPNLDFLPYTIPLTGTGILMLIPWLRHQKVKFLWVLLYVYLALVGVMILIEVVLVIAGFG